MKLFADTANIEEINYCFSRGVNDGITTNPKIIEVTGDISKGFEGASKLILNNFSDVPVSLETDLRGLDVKNLEKIDPLVVKNVLLSQAYEISGWGKNTVIKIPICEGGLLAVDELSKHNIKTNVTACMNPYQAIRAANSGANYVSLFANRMLDSHILQLSGYPLEEIVNNKNWKDIINLHKEKYFEEAWDKTLNEISYVASSLKKGDSELIVGSIRTPEDIYRLVKAEPHIITIPTKIVKGLENIEDLKLTSRSIFFFEDKSKKSLYHPMTQYTLEEFEESTKSYRH